MHQVMKVRFSVFKIKFSTRTNFFYSGQYIYSFCYYCQRTITQLKIKRNKVYQSKPYNVVSYIQKTGLHKVFGLFQFDCP